MSGVTVVIPTWNRRDLLERVLRSLESQTRRPDEVLVVDNGSHDGSAELACERGAAAVRLDRNYGFARAVNEGLRRCSAEWVAVLNNDTEPAADWLEKLLDACRRPGCWFATGKIVNARQPEILDGTYDLLCRGGCSWRAGNGRADSPLWSTPGPALFPSFTAALFRRELFERVGLLDERLESYLEDVDFGLRCAHAGYEGVYVPEAVTAHISGATLGGWSGRMVRLISRNQVLLVAKHYPPGWVLRYGWPVLVGQLLWGMLAARHGRLIAWLLGKWDGVREWRRIRSETKHASPEQLAAVLERSEQELERLQRASGFDWLWRTYFWAT